MTETTPPADPQAVAARAAMLRSMSDAVHRAVTLADGPTVIVLPDGVTEDEWTAMVDQDPTTHDVVVIVGTPRQAEANWPDHDLIVWEGDDGRGRSRFLEYTRTVTGGAGHTDLLTFSITMHDVLTAWRGHDIAYDEDGPSDWTGGPLTIEQAVVSAAAQVLASRFQSSSLTSSVNAEVQRVVNETMRDEIAAFVRTKLAEPIQRTDHMGRPQGDPVTLFEVAETMVGTVLTERVYGKDGKRSNGYSSDRDPKFTLPETVIRTRVTGHLTKELTAAVDQAKAAAVDAVRQEATTIVADTIAARLAVIHEQAPRT